MILRILIEEKLSSVKVFYPEAKIIPKLIYMVHYPIAQMEHYGPLISRDASPALG